MTEASKQPKLAESFRIVKNAADYLAVAPDGKPPFLTVSGKLARVTSGIRHHVE